MDECKPLGGGDVPERRVRGADDGAGAVRARGPDRAHGPGLEAGPGTCHFIFILFYNVHRAPRRYTW